MKKFDAPWGKSLVVLSLLTTLLCVGISVVLAWKSQEILSWAVLIPLCIPVGSATFTIRGYSVDSKAILVHRLLWATRVPLTGLQTAQYEPDAMCGSTRLFGNSGLFSITGLFSNKAIGTYRAFVTDSHRTVLLKFPARTIVVSPEQPEAFVQAVSGANVG